MKLKLTRSQEQGMLGSVKFRLHAIVLLDEAERDAVFTYKLHNEIVYSKEKFNPAYASNVVTAIGRMAAAIAFNIKLTVNDMIHGQTIECNEITEMLAAEEQIREACEVLTSILHAATNFGGEEVVEL